VCVRADMKKAVRASPRLVSANALKSNIEKTNQRRAHINHETVPTINKRKHVEVEFENSKTNKRVADRKLLEKEIKKSKEPEKWIEVWDIINQMRSTVQAPVDVVGCEALSLKEASDPKRYRLAALISLMLSSQTKDQMTAKAMKNLGEYGLTIDRLLAIEDSALDKLIGCVGFHSKKTVYIKKTVKILREKYDDDIPPTLEEILELPGVGPKMGHLLMQVGWEKTVGIGVDVHVHRISNRLGWAKTKTPEKTREELESWLPKEYWRPINVLLVGFGQVQCTPVNPECDTCLANHLCPSAPAFLKEKEKREKKKKQKRKGKTAQPEEQSEDCK